MFKTDLILRQTPESSKYWEVYAPLTYRSLEGDVLTVPKNFLTDLASIPAFLRSFLSTTGRYNKAAVLHDFLYNRHIKTRKESDGLFLEAMKELGVGCLKRYILFLGVRIFGGRSWTNSTHSKPRALTPGEE